METKPKKPRTKKRFTSREQILARIEKFTAKARHQRTIQTECYKQAIHLRSMAERSNPDDKSDAYAKANKKDLEGDKLGKKADRLERDVLGALRAKLAEFDTEIIPGIISDKSIEAV